MADYGVYTDTIREAEKALAVAQAAVTRAKRAAAGETGDFEVAVALAGVRDYGQRALDALIKVTDLPAAAFATAKAR